MTNLTNQDNIGNYYFGFRTNNSLFNSAQIGINYSTLINWINSSFGENCAAGSNEDQFSLILPHPNETLTRPAIANTGLFDGKFRFTHNRIATVNSNIVVGSAQPGRSIFTGKSLNLNEDGSLVYYAVLNQFSLNIFSSGFVGNNLSQPFRFFSIGFLRNPLYLGNAFPRNAYNYVLSTFETSSGVRPDLENTSESMQLSVNASIVNYPISCQVATSGANATEFYLRDAVAPNKAIGYVSNVLKSSLDIPIGQIYKNTGVDPDNSNNPYWICVGKIGNESILMRVWATGLGD